MMRRSLAPDSPRFLYRDAMTIAVLIGSMLLSFSTAAYAADDARTDDAPVAKLDFLFSPPRFSIGVRGGWAFNRSEGEIYTFLTETLTLEKSDFDSFAFALDFSWQVMPWLDAVLGFEVSSSTATSEFRNFVDTSGAPIVQDTRLSQIPLTVSVRLYPFERGRRVGRFAWIPARFVPYLGGGIGGTWYELEQAGEFVDFMDLTIFEDVLTSSGWTFAGHAFAGFDIKLTSSIGLVLEGRYYFATADLGGSYVDFEPIDLDGARAMAGINWKF